jgi:hypothetical protein
MTLLKEIERFTAEQAPAAFEFASQNIEANWIEDALQETGMKSIRRRKLPSDVVAWLVIAMAIFRDRSIAAVLSHLGLAQGDDMVGGRGKVAPAAIPQARQRVGPKPIEAIFRKSVQVWSEKLADLDCWKGFRIYAVDGTSLNVADTEENHNHIGRPKSGRSTASYPKLRMVAISQPRSHLIVDMSFGAFAKSEYELAEPMWDRIAPNSITIVDRGFLSYELLQRLYKKDESKHWLIRSKSNTKWKTLKNFGPGDQLVELKVSSHARRKDPGLPRSIQARAIQYTRPGFRTQILLTSLADPTICKAQEIVELYHDRWEIELAFDEQKTHMQERKEALRSKKPACVEQEVWGIAVAYNVIRLMMANVAKENGVPPNRISFWNTLLLIRAFALSAWFVAPGTIPRMYNDLTSNMRSILILPQRKPRSNPRMVKRKMSGFQKKQPPSYAREP